MQHDIWNYVLNWNNDTAKANHKNTISEKPAKDSLNFILYIKNSKLAFITIFSLTQHGE